MTKTTTAEMFARNMDFLMRELNLRPAELARRSGVSGRMITYIRSGERVPTIETADAIGRALGVTGWQMLLPNLTRDLLASGRLQKLIEHYGELTPKTREFIDHVVNHDVDN